MTTLHAFPQPVHQKPPHMRALLDSLRLSDAAQYLAAEVDMEVDEPVEDWTERPLAQRDAYVKRVENMLRLLDRPLGASSVKPSHVALALEDRVREVVALLMRPDVSLKDARDAAVQELLRVVAEGVALERDVRR